jgi:hypothetical protein
MVAALLGTAGARAEAQQPVTTSLDFTAGSAREDYLRVLQVAGIVPLHPWSLRAFSSLELERLIRADTSGPWALARQHANRTATIGPLAAGAIFNTAYPYGINDGPVWAGRGVTVTASGGVALKAGALSVALAPTAFRSANQSFPLMRNGETGDGAFRDPAWPTQVDRPQRFGDEPYGRVDPGASSVRLDTRLLTVGVSTANDWIGPATLYPFLLGNNAPGFLRAFVGTGTPLPILIGHLHGRVMWGRLEQTEYSPVTGSDKYFSPSEPGRARFATSATFMYLPRWIPGLELGFSRFQHLPYPQDGIPRSYVTKPLTFYLLAEEIERPSLDNQLASAFFRWVFPSAGFEIYGERGHEDWFTDTRELMQESDYYRSYNLGAQKILGRLSTGGRIDVLRAELMNYQMSTTGRRRSNAWTIYAHSTFSQGHTNRGQLLGTNAGVGVGAASALSWTRYTPRGRMTAGWHRIVRDQAGDFHESGIRDDDATDVIHALGFERTRFFRRFDWTLGVTGMQNFNRHYESDVFNLNVRSTFTFRVH